MPAATYGSAGLSTTTAVSGGVMKLPLAGWSQVGSTGKWNPLYRWDDPKFGHKVVVPATNPEGAFAPHYLQIGVDGRIYQIGNSRTHGGYGNGHGGIRISNSSGSVVSTFMMPDKTDSPEGSLNGFTPTRSAARASSSPTASTSLTVRVSALDVRTEDGLKIARALPGQPAGYGAGWPDQNMSLGGLRLPGDAAGTRHAYVEDDAHSKAVRYTFHGLDTVLRTSKRFLAAEARLG